VLVNGLIDCSGPPEEAAAQAVAAVEEKGYGCLKIKASCCFSPVLTENTHPDRLFFPCADGKHPS